MATSNQIPADAQAPTSSVTLGLYLPTCWAAARARDQPVPDWRPFKHNSDCQLAGKALTISLARQRRIVASPLTPEFYEQSYQVNRLIVQDIRGRAAQKATNSAVNQQTISAHDDTLPRTRTGL